MILKKTSVIVNGKEIDLTGYFETLPREPNQSEFYTKIGVSS
ncbi:hypothetical protein [Elizabethkingia anophelis]|nr:hypothetical protein [Elizabethkingia anophelis]